MPEPEQQNIQDITNDQHRVLPDSWIFNNFIRSLQMTTPKGAVACMNWAELPQHNYTFKVVEIRNINFAKIADDLSYSDPLRLVEVAGQLHAVIHHTIYDKAIRSTASQSYHGGIIQGHIKIEPKEIKTIVKDIQIIKRAKWGKPSAPPTIEVKVTKVKI